jgi:hypothetical protein
VALLVLILLQLWVPIWFGGTGYSGSSFPNAEGLANDYDSNIGKEVVLYGQVVNLDPVRIQIDLDNGDEIYYEVVGVERDVATGEYLEVYGTLDFEHTVLAQNVVIRDEREHWYTYGVSLVGVAIVFVRIVRDWGFDVEQLALSPKDNNA